MRRELGKLGLAEGLVARGAGRNRQLEKIAALVDGASFARLLGAVYAAIATLSRPDQQCVRRSCHQNSRENAGRGRPKACPAGERAIMRRRLPTAATTWPPAGSSQAETHGNQTTAIRQP
jgi:hypothetical protein